MITLSKVSKRFGQTAAVSGISFTVKPGEIIGLLGPNGAGKTTTLRMLSGVLPPTKGKVIIDGQNFLEHEAQLKQRIGYLPEENPLYEELTVEEHLIFWAKMKRIPKSQWQEAIDYAVKRVGIGEVYYRLIGELSKGYRQRVGLAQAILSKPDILLLDEPTEGLDPNQRRDIQKLLAELGESRTVVVSSHVLGEISKLANRIVIIADGQVVGDDTPANLVKAKGGKQVVVVEVVGSGVKSGLASIAGVESVNKDGSMYQVVSSQKKDLRAQIFALAVKKKWTLLTLMAVERQLEDVFAELTE